MAAAEEETKVIQLVPLNKDEAHVLVLKDDKGVRGWCCEDYPIAESLLERYCEEKWCELDPKAEIQPNRSDIIDDFFKLAEGTRLAFIVPCHTIIDWQRVYEVPL